MASGPCNTAASTGSTPQQQQQPQHSAVRPIRPIRRLHGLQLPLHPQQILGWGLLLLFAGSGFLLLIPALSPVLWPVLYSILSSLFAVHTAAHFAAVLLDPADPELLKQPNISTIVPEFDRTKHAHVIENGRCHLCNITTSSHRTKHCSVCNKCVGRFDHHCKWLNHCIGGRNYLCFLICVVSSVLACLLILGLCLAVLILFHTDPSWLTVWYYSPFNGRLYEPHSFNMFAIDDKLFLCLTGAIGILAAISAGLLIHLCLFHAYISYLGITTYEYIRNYRAPRRIPEPPEAVFTVQSNYRNSCQRILKTSEKQVSERKIESVHRVSNGKANGLVVRKTCPGCRYCQMLKADPTLKEQIDAYTRKSARRKSHGGSWSVCGNDADFRRRSNQVRPSRSVPASLSQLPSLPPPTRRQIQAVSLKELSEVLAAVQGPAPTSSSTSTATTTRLQKRSLPPLRRRSPLSPTLSPIHESGLSNPSTPRLTLRPAQQPQLQQRAAAVWLPSPLAR